MVRQESFQPVVYKDVIPTMKLNLALSHNQDVFEHGSERLRNPSMYHGLFRFPNQPQNAIPNLIRGTYNYWYL
jgi:hypothetical protein